MIAKPIRQLIEDNSYVVIATADISGQPHIAAGDRIIVSGDSLLIFENWFCPATLQNIAVNARVSVVVFRPDTRTGYQMLGSVMRNGDTSVHAGHGPAAVRLEAIQVLTRFTVKIEQVLEFNSGIHSDIPIAA